MGFCVKYIENQTIIDIQDSKLKCSIVHDLNKIINKLIKLNRLNILINMVNVKFIDSTLFYTLISAQNRCMNRGGKVSIYGVQHDLLIILYIVKLDKYIDIYINEFDALRKNNAIVKRRLRAV